MLMGYDDSGKRVKYCHMPLRSIISGHRHARDLSNRSKRYNWGKDKFVGVHALINFPYSTVSGNGWDPFRSKQVFSYYKVKRPTF